MKREIRKISLGELMDDLKELPLRNRIRTTIHSVMLGVPSDLGFIEMRMWTDEDDELLGKLEKIGKKLTDEIMRDIEEWEKDGKPNR
jgi:hypothetical protein